ncbi:YHYH protein [filamentous cyanobacterium LEGE 11480]|uniref:YHYH protein n=1 Tax=Romeriopsis navalis LEGE 11480 TaxID=2777977 RepID=A0A928VMM5_9CYAN|nr:YHYH protein [Romeriopsis navalis]MBE9030488.1 YHYH protein [Romeriopsis navalis LEGE 11480]
MNYTYRRLIPLTLGLLSSFAASCTSTGESAPPLAGLPTKPEISATTSKQSVVAVNPDFFIQANLAKPIQQEDCTLSDGTKTSCYSITINPTPQEHKMGPWCPTHVKDGKDKGGLWFRDGKIYDVDGAFIANLADFYADPDWKLVNPDGSIRVTKTQAAFEAAARPDVDPNYNNYCVEGRPEWYTVQAKTYKIPVTPIYQKTPTRFDRNGVGVAFNGVNFDPPAPVDAILNAHTLAPLDDNGGHMNPHAGYHYHAATGRTKEIAQSDNHAPMIGYALDGFGIYALLDPDTKAPTDLDESRGHSDAVRGYHYHAGTPGSNEIIRSFRGAVVNSMSDLPGQSGRPGADGRPPRPR